MPAGLQIYWLAPVNGSFSFTLRNKRVNEKYINLRLGDVRNDKKALVVQLDQYLLTNASMKTHRAISDMQKLLDG